MPLAVLDIKHLSKPGSWAAGGAVASVVEEVDLTERRTPIP